jgi:hypothetical protein
VSVQVEAALEFSVSMPGAREVTGRLHGSGTSLTVDVSDPFVFAGRQDAEAIRGLAATLAHGGLTVTVVGPSGPLVTLGAPRTSWLQRRLTRSRHIRIERGAGLWSLARGRAQATNAGGLPVGELAPPPTMWPPAPTFLRLRRHVTTTHDPAHGGNPRLVMAAPKHPHPEDRPPVFPLHREVTTIGSALGADIVLPGLAPRHAEVHHDELNEFVVVRVSAAPVRVNGSPVDRALLRNATRVELGDWTLSYSREEHADHGRPYGGRLGGELGHQRSQPPRAPRRSGGDQAAPAGS